MSGDVRDAGLYTRYVAFMRAALALVRKHQSGKPVPTRLRTRVRRRDASIAEFEREQEPDVFMMLAPHCVAFEKLPEFQSLYRYIASSSLADCVFVDAANNPIREARTQSSWLMNFYAVPLLMRYIGPEMLLQFEEGRAKSVYAGLEEFLESGQVVYSIVAPLAGFEGSHQEVRLGTATVLRKLRDDEIEYLWDLSESGGIAERHQVLTMTCCLETADFRTDSQVQAQLIAAVTALRLLKPGQVGVPLLVRHPHQPAFGATSGYATSGPSPASMGTTYVFTAGDAGELSAVFDALASARPSMQLRRALDRFNYAYQRTWSDDKLIDYWVALEALFLADGRQELRYRASLRVAWFVAEGSRERGEIFSQIRDSYDARSDIVHGGEPNDVPNIAQFTENVLRRALRKAVATPGSLDVKQLDDLIVRGSPCVENAHDPRVPPA